MKFSKGVIGYILILAMLLTFVNAALFFNVSAATGIKYYVDSVNGDDGNNGTSELTAWKTLDKVNNKTFLPGDSILLKRDCIWNGVLFPKGSGASGSPITIDTYGAGNLPCINGNGKKLETAPDPNDATKTIITDYIDAAVYLQDQSHWAIRNLEVTNFVQGDTELTQVADRMGIHIDGIHYGVKQSDITIEYCKVHDVASDGNNSEHARMAGIIMWARSWNTGYKDVKIDNNEIYKTGSTGIHINCEDYTNTTTNAVIENNYLHDIGGDGVMILSATDSITKNNIINGSHTRSKTFCCAIWPFSCNNAILENNEAYNTKTTVDGGGLDADYQCHNTIFQYNYSHNNEGGGAGACCEVKTWDGKTSWNDKPVFRYNILQNNGNIEFAITTKVTDCYFYNNDVYIKSGLSTKVMGVYSKDKGVTWPTGVYMWNNIIVNYGGGGYLDLDKCVNLQWDSNIFYGRNAMSEPYDLHKITLDPKFVNAGGAGDGFSTCDAYKLTEGSPAIGSGKLIADNGGKDFWNNPVSATEAPNRGADNTQISPPTSSSVAIGTMNKGSASINLEDFETSNIFAQYGVGPAAGTSSTLALSSENVNPAGGSTKALEISFMPNLTSGGKGGVQMNTTNAALMTKIKSAFTTQGFNSSGLRCWMKFTEGDPNYINIAGISLFSSYTIPGMGSKFAGSGTIDENGCLSIPWGSMSSYYNGVNYRMFDASRQDLANFIAGVNTLQIYFTVTYGNHTTLYIDDLQMYGYNYAPETTTVTTATTSTTTSETTTTQTPFTMPYKTGEGAIWGLSPDSNTVDEFINSFNPQSNTKITIYDKNNNVVTTGRVGTGMKVNINFDNQTVEQLTVYLYGDNTGDGIIDSLDLLAVKKHLLQIKVLTGDYLKAADTDRSSVVDTADLLKLKKAILKLTPISQD